MNQLLDYSIESLEIDCKLRIENCKLQATHIEELALLYQICG